MAAARNLHSAFHFTTITEEYYALCVGKKNFKEDIWSKEGRE
jgi:hypothetical protein